MRERDVLLTYAAVFLVLVMWLLALNVVYAEGAMLMTRPGCQADCSCAQTVNDDRPYEYFSTEVITLRGEECSKGFQRKAWRMCRMFCRSGLKLQPKVGA